MVSDQHTNNLKKFRNDDIYCNELGLLYRTDIDPFIFCVFVSARV